jgi:site-specific recombinase XerD
LAGEAAYKQIDTRLKQVAREAGLTERVHLHRLRRTVAVRALAQTNDIAAVQQMLGHRSIQTTARYVDEARPEALAGIQQSINPRRKPT